jgi:hypothetical protein
MDKAKRDCSITQRELLVIMKTLDHFRKYLCGQEFHLCTDCSTLTCMIISALLSQFIQLNCIFYENYAAGQNFIKNNFHPSSRRNLSESIGMKI